MLFSSIGFLFYFLPVVIGGYFLLPARLRNGFLLLASLVFYFLGEPLYTLLLLGTSVSAYVHGLLIDRFRGRPLGRVFFVTALAVGIGALALFKYADFAISNVNALFGTNAALWKLALPLGISFYTFQQLSYVVDVYRGTVPAQRNPIKLLTYVTLFPQLVAGPIVRYSDVQHDLTHRVSSIADVADGASRFVTGLAKKVLLANTLGSLAEAYRASADRSVLFGWLYAAAVMLQIYYDFSGYSDMAIGLGRIFGFRFPENFNYPYISASVTEFWRRWHMTLGGWFRDYVYIPLGGSRVKKGKWIRNVFVVWLLTGLWHGADWTFVIWGLFFAVLLVIEKPLLGRMAPRMRWVARFYVLPALALSFVVFNANGMQQALADLGGMFGAGGLPFVSAETLYYLKSYAVLLVIGAVGATPLPSRLVARLREKVRLRPVMTVAEPLLLAALLVACTAYLVDGSFNPFLYFRF